MHLPETHLGHYAGKSGHSHVNRNFYYVLFVDFDESERTIHPCARGTLNTLVIEPRRLTE